MPVSRRPHFQGSHATRIMASLAVVLLLTIALVRWWPAPEGLRPDAAVYSTRGQELIQVEEIQPTRQAQRRPPPPVPLLPIVAPKEVLLEDLDLDLNAQAPPTEQPGEDLEERAGDSADRSAQLVRAAVGPRLVRFVEPAYTPAARRQRVRARVTLEVFVDEQGRVQEATVLERALLDEHGEPVERVERLGYGLEEAALEAAGRWLFRPAREAGRPVPSYTTLTFGFGV